MRNLLVAGSMLLPFACGNSPAPEPKPNFEGFAVIERGAGARYVIDTRSQVCLLAIDRAITTPVDCRTLKKNVEEARKHLGWLEDPASKATPDLGSGLFGAPPSNHIRQTGPYSYVIDRAFLHAQLQKPSRLWKRPDRALAEERQTQRPQALAVRPHSILAGLGFRNGDTVERINGRDVGTPDKVVELYSKIKLKGVSVVVVALSRRGRPITLTITIAERSRAGSVSTGKKSSLIDQQMDEANDAYDRQDYERAQTLAIRVLGAIPATFACCAWWCRRRASSGMSPGPGATTPTCQRATSATCRSAALATA